MNENTTPFLEVYDYFLSKVSDDLYLELTKIDTYRMLQDLLVAAIHKFEFPRVDLFDYDISGEISESEYEGVESDYEVCPITLYDDGHFNHLLTHEEMNILATYMAVEWLGQQLANIENTRMKYPGAD